MVETVNYTVNNIDFPSCDGVHTLKGKIYLPEGKKKGIFHLVHGMTEHIDRYDRLFAEIAKEGFVVAAYDNLGHGKTADSDGSFGFIAREKGWELLVEDTAAFGRHLKELYRGLPLYLMGHSMGSFIVRLSAEKYPQLYSKLVICGTSGKNPIAGAGLMLTKTLKKLKGEKYISNFCLNIAFGSYNKKFEKATKYEWLTARKEIIEKYSKDRFCTFKFTVSALCDLITLIIRCNRKDWYKNIRKDMPILIISGDMDPVGNYGKGIKQVYGDLLREGAQVQMKLFENGRHEIHNDLCEQEVISLLREFLKEEV